MPPLANVSVAMANIDQDVQYFASGCLASGV
jgi:hypothetical protein